jgi:hypothetical protein
MTPNAAELLAPLTNDEKKEVVKAALRLFDKPDFQLVYRSLNADVGGILNPAFEMGGDAIKAAFREGQKEPLRWLFAMFLKGIPETEKPNKQET